MKAKGGRGRRFATALLGLSLLCPGAVPAAEKALPVSVTFEGNDDFEESRLRSSIAADLEDIKEGKDLRMAVDDASYLLESLYRKEGYHFAVVNYEIDEEEGKTVFRIEEGPRVLLGELIFEGNEFFADEDLEVFFGRGGESVSAKVLSVVTLGAAEAGQEEIPFVESRVESAVGSVGDLYYVKGFVAYEVSDPEVRFSEDRSRADVTVRIVEGPQHFVRAVTFSGDLIPEVKDDLEKLRTSLAGETFMVARRTALRTRTVEIYRIAGYPDVTVEVEEGSGPGPGDVTLEAVIESGPRVRIASIDIEGNRKTRESFIRSRIVLEPGDWYDLTKERESFMSLNRTGVFRSIEGSLEGEEGAEERPLKITVVERPSRRAIFDVGWGSYEQARGAVGFVERNFFGTGREVGGIVGASTKGYYVRGMATDPWFFGTDITLSGPLDYSKRENPSYTEEKIEAAAVLTKKITGHISGSLRYGFKSSNTTDIDVEEPDPDFQENYNMGSLRLRFTHDSRDDYFYPSGGNQGSISFEIADPLLGGDVSFFRLTFAFSSFFAFGDDTVLALRWDSGFLYPTNERTAVPLPERFFNGGESTVRSFKEDQLGPKDLERDPTGGLASNVISVELRQRLVGNLAGSLFVDAGNVVPNKTRVEQGLPPYESVGDLLDDVSGEYFKEFHYGVGAGLQYLLPVGPLRLDVAWNPDRQKGEDEWVAHFSLGMSF